MLIVNRSFKVFEVFVDSMADYHTLVALLPENMSIFDDGLVDGEIVVYIACDDLAELRFWLSSNFGVEVRCNDEQEV